MSANAKPPKSYKGTVYNSNGYWFYLGKLPNSDKRKAYKLCAPNSSTAMRADRPREKALEAAYRLWADAAKEARDQPTSCLQVEDLCARYLAYAKVYYRGSHEVYLCGRACRALISRFGRRPIADLVHRDLLAVRDDLVRANLSRTTVNRYMGIICGRMMPWALDEGLVSAQVKAELSQVQPLKRGRSPARETTPVREVADDVVDRILPLLPPNTADMVRVHRLTGMRPAELCAMRWVDIDTTRTPWIYHPQHHKNEWRDQPRAILIGPRARTILLRHRDAPYPFSPIAAVAERMQAKRAARTSPFYPCRDQSYSRADPFAVRVPRDHWSADTYGRTLRRVATQVGVSLAPNQLRHAFATEVRRRYGLEACRAVLGHSTGAEVTDRYSYAAIEDEMIGKAREAVEAMG